jgi:hypothetical protein
MNNLILTLGGGLIPLFTGFIWYSDQLLGKAWKKEIGFVDNGEKPTGMGRIFLLSYIFGVMAMFFMPALVIHQFHMVSTLYGTEGFGTEGSAVQQFYNDFVANYGMKYRSFKHGVLHGIITAIFVGLPLIGMNAIFEKKSFKYIFIHLGYWILTLALMGGLACSFYEISI